MSGNLYICFGKFKSGQINVDNNSDVIFFDQQPDTVKENLSLSYIFLNKEDHFRKKLLEFQNKVFLRIKSNKRVNCRFEYILSNLFFESSPYKTNTTFIFFKLLMVIDIIKSKK